MSDEGGDNTNAYTAPIAPAGRRQQLLVTMIETLRTMGYENITARIPNFKPPAVIKGTQADHRPDLIAHFRGQHVKRGALLDVVTTQAVTDANFEGRLQLLCNASEHLSAELHFAVPHAIVKATGEKVKAALKKKLERMHFNRAIIWEI